MRLFCRLCGARTDGRERLGVYCPGECCGTDLRVDGGGVQAWIEPARQRGQAGHAVTVRMHVRNTGAYPDTYRVEPVERVEGRLEFDAAPLTVPLPPGRTQVVEIRYTLPADRVGQGLDIASRFGIPGADVLGEAHEAQSDRFGVALRVVSTTGGRGAACAAFAVDVPGRLHFDRQQGNTGAARGRSLPMLVGAVVVALIVVGAAVVALAANKDDDGGSTASGPGRSVTSGGGFADSGGFGPGPDTPVTAPITTPGSGNGGAKGSVSGNGNGNSNGNSNGIGGKSGGNGSGTDFVTLPDLTGKTTDEADKKLKELGLTADGEWVENTGPAENTVLSTVPKGGTKVQRGSQVFVKLSDGRANVPDVIGKSEADAVAAIRKNGFTTARATDYPRGEGQSCALGTVLSTDPGPNKSKPYGSSVTVTVCQKPLIK
ncbi:PASTA domain-containing protein [Yinghuangia seranimata]|uniref:PASTA domain-containing protein n=1 Tax=Yinghuangia seranimata TaxID=408067 RepID=UPI00248CD40A|nr:PASTA domain-containing protein [Yinghuangia seranimata]MDI2128580.1 PASTA domain-containing protein [Yinghuangia seranimata]